MARFNFYLFECSRCAPGLPFFWAELGRECSQSLGELQVVQHLHHTGKVLYTGRGGDSDYTNQAETCNTSGEAQCITFQSYLESKKILYAS